MKRYIHTILRGIVGGSTMLLFAACASQAPVQEMSNARQTLNLARLANAQKYAQKKYIKAQEILDMAVTELNSGDFTEARRLALQAAQAARQAQLIALNQQKK